jgi:hypothetical protein
MDNIGREFGDLSKTTVFKKKTAEKKGEMSHSVAHVFSQSFFSNIGDHSRSRPR